VLLLVVAVDTKMELEPMHNFATLRGLLLTNKLALSLLQIIATILFEESHPKVTPPFFCSNICLTLQQGEVSTLAGSREKKAGHVDGIGPGALFNCPRGIYFDEKDQYLLVCDCNNSKIRRVTLNGMSYHQFLH